MSSNPRGDALLRHARFWRDIALRQVLGFSRSHHDGAGEARRVSSAPRCPRWPGGPRTCSSASPPEPPRPARPCARDRDRDRNATVAGTTRPHHRAGIVASSWARRSRRPGSPAPVGVPVCCTWKRVPDHAVVDDAVGARAHLGKNAVPAPSSMQSCVRSLDREPRWTCRSHRARCGRRRGLKRTLKRNTEKKRGCSSRFTSPRRCRIHAGWPSGGYRRYGFEATEQWLRFNNAPAPVTLRVNTLRRTPDQLASELATHGVDTVRSRWTPDALIVTQGKPDDDTPRHSRALLAPGRSVATRCPVGDGGPRAAYPRHVCVPGREVAGLSRARSVTQDCWSAATCARDVSLSSRRS